MYEYCIILKTGILNKFKDIDFYTYILSKNDHQEYVYVYFLSLTVKQQPYKLYALDWSKMKVQFLQEVPKIFYPA